MEKFTGQKLLDKYWNIWIVEYFSSYFFLSKSCYYCSLEILLEKSILRVFYDHFKDTK